MKCPDKESYLWARRLLREEGLMCGGSSGSAFWGAIEYIKKNKIGKGKRCVVLLPDNIRNYMTKHLNNDWMYERGYITEQACAKGCQNEYIPNEDWGQNKTCGELVSTLGLKEATFLDVDTPISDVTNKMLDLGFAQYPVREKSGKIIGVATKTELLSKLVKKRVSNSDPVRSITQRELRHVSNETTLNELGRVLTRNRFVLVDKRYIVTSSDLLKLVSGRGPVPPSTPATIAADTPFSIVDDKSPDSPRGGDDNSTLKLTATAVAAAGIGAVAAFMFMKQN